jgi:type IV pilus assembly protein PilO
VEIAGVELSELEYDNIGNWPGFLRAVVIVVTCLVVLVLGYLLYLGDKVDALSSASSKMETLSQSFVTTQHQVANLEVYKKEVKIVQEQLDKMTEQLPQSNEESGLLRDISQQAVSSGLQIISIKPGKSVNKGFYEENPIELTLTGNYSNFGDFASNISDMARIVTLHGFAISRNIAPNASVSTGTGFLKMVVDAKTYWTITKELRE